jgi:hypothetical protein
MASLSVWLYLTYLNDIYFQTYANSLSPILVPVLSVAFGISSASIATYLYLGMKRIRTSHEPQAPVRGRVHPRKTPKRPPKPSTSQPNFADLSQTTPAKLKPIAPPQSHVQTQKPPLKEQDDHASNPEARKRP